MKQVTELDEQQQRKMRLKKNEEKSRKSNLTREYIQKLKEMTSGENTMGTTEIR